MCGERKDLVKFIYREGEERKDVVKIMYRKEGYSKVYVKKV